MKRYLIVGVPLALLAALMFVKPPTFSSTKSPSPTLNSGTTGVTGANNSTIGKPGVNGSSESDEEGKPAYGGHDADDYDD